MTTDRVVLSGLIAELILRQLPCGGWVALASSSQPALEPTCFAALALGLFPGGALGRAQEFLLHAQNPNGSWPAFAGDDTDGAWVTSLAVIALHDVVPMTPGRLRGVHWLMSCAGKESNWFWKWKFRTTDRHVRFDPNKFGWPWFPDTVSWVVPTTFAILALNQLPCSCGGLEQVPFRVERGVEMLLDRVCSDGGWNAGNGVVYGVPVAPHPDDTAIALLALKEHERDPVVQSSVQYLERIAPSLRATWSLAWAILALATYGGLQHFWSGRFRSSIVYSFVQVQNTLAQPGTVYHQGNYTAGNLIWNPFGSLTVGTEFLYGWRVNKDGSSGNAPRIQFSAKYNFVRTQAAE